jgi:1,4-dihydroxy-2-naphthoate octaprenyltransferase
MPPRTQRERTHNLGVFLELGKFKIVELWLGFFVSVALLGQSRLYDERSLGILALILIAGIAVIAATCSLDDIVGVRDGVDQANHCEGARWGVDKPLLAGRLDERSAFRFVHLLGVVAVLGYVLVLVLAWPLPGWLLAIMTAMMLLAINYSYGLKLSYHGAGEAVIFAGGAGTVLLPYALVTKSAPPIVVVSAILVGSWHAQVVMFSNTKDIAGDRATGRMTIAARTSPRGNKIFIASAFVLVWGLTAFSFAAGYIPAWYALALAPVWVMQVTQLWLGLHREQWLKARLLGFRVLRVGIVALTISSLGFPI